MKKLLTLLFLSLVATNINAQNIAIQTFGNAKDKPILFLHGGPGYNSVAFEQTTAEKLSENGFYVISYDRRGEGRNDQLKAEFTFEQTFEDLNQIYKTYELNKSTLIGHSFGGVVATLFAEKYPEKIETLILVGSPISMQETLKNVISKSKAIYISNDDKVNLNYINMLEKMDSTSLEYSSYTFMHAMSNGFYSTKMPNEKAISLYQKFKTDSLLKIYASKMQYLAPQKFWENEKYTSITLAKNVKDLVAKKVPCFAISGKEDGLYSKEQVANLKNILGDTMVEYLENCSHNVFIDRQEKFIELLNNWTKK
jgi:proline iminopeptidase